MEKTTTGVNKKMEIEYLSKELHNEFAKRIEAEEDRQNKRIAQLETGLMRITDMTASIERLAVNMENMNAEVHEQSERLAVIEQKDGQMWQKVLSYTITAVLSIIIGFVARSIGLS